MSKTNVSLLAFKKLVKKYRSITKKQVEKAELIACDNRTNNILSVLTGFAQHNCILCKAVKGVCPSCLHTEYQQSFDNSAFENYYLNSHACFKAMSLKTYDVFESSFTTYEDFMVLVNARADYLQIIIDWYEKEQNKLNK